MKLFFEGLGWGFLTGSPLILLAVIVRLIEGARP